MFENIHSHHDLSSPLWASGLPRRISSAQCDSVGLTPCTKKLEVGDLLSKSEVGLVYIGCSRATQ